MVPLRPAATRVASLRTSDTGNPAARCQQERPGQATQESCRSAQRQAAAARTAVGRVRAAAGDVRGAAAQALIHADQRGLPLQLRQRLVHEQHVAHDCQDAHRARHQRRQQERPGGAPGARSGARHAQNLLRSAGKARIMCQSQTCSGCQSSSLPMQAQRRRL